MRYHAVLFLLAAVLAPALAAEPAASPTEIRPLLIGAKVPAVTVRTAAGEPFDLAAAVAADPLVLIVYRGGW